MRIAEQVDIPHEWLEESEAAAHRPLETRLRYAFIYTYKPVLDDASYRAFDAMEDYQRWCEEKLPDWEEQQERARREKRAWALARQAVALLRKQVGATRVVVFGSLVHKGMFTLWSDVDIAAWGIQPRDTLALETLL